MKKHHVLKIEQHHYDNIMVGLKDFEVRFNDRDYQKGDTISFTTVNGHLNRPGEFEIKHVHSGLGMAENYVVLGLKRLS